MVPTFMIKGDVQECGSDKGIKLMSQSMKL